MTEHSHCKTRMTEGYKMSSWDIFPCLSAVQGSPPDETNMKYIALEGCHIVAELSPGQVKLQKHVRALNCVLLLFWLVDQSDKALVHFIIVFSSSNPFLCPLAHPEKPGAAQQMLLLLCELLNYDDLPKYLLKCTCS